MYALHKRKKEGLIAKTFGKVQVGENPRQMPGTSGLPKIFAKRNRFSPQSVL